MSELNIIPLHDRVIVKQDAAEDMVGSIIIPDTWKEKPNKGTVVAVGKGIKDEPMVVKDGDRVLYGKNAGMPIEVEGVGYLIMRESDILAVV